MKKIKKNFVLSLSVLAFGLNAFGEAEADKSAATEARRAFIQQRYSEIATLGTELNALKNQIDEVELAQNIAVTVSMTATAWNLVRSTLPVKPVAATRSYANGMTVASYKWKAVPRRFSDRAGFYAGASVILLTLPRYQLSNMRSQVVQLEAQLKVAATSLSMMTAQTELAN